MYFDDLSSTSVPSSASRGMTCCINLWRRLLVGRNLDRSLNFPIRVVSSLLAEKTILQ